MIYGDRIRELREKLGLSQDELARRSGVSVATLRSYETEKRTGSIGLEILTKLADFFHVPVDYILGRSEKDWSVNIDSLKTTSYELYLIKRREYTPIKGVYPPYPYNVLEDMFNEPWLSALTDDQKDGFNKALEMLSPREQDCLKLYYRDGIPLDKIGVEFNVGRERIRQIIAKGLRKLRNPERSRYIRYGAVGWYTYDNLRKAELRKKHLKEIISQCNKMEECLSKTNPDFVKVAEKGSALDIPIIELDLSVRSYNCLRRWGHYATGHEIKCLRDLTFVTEEELMKCRNLGRRSVEEIKKKMAEYGLHLMEVEK